MQRLNKTLSLLVLTALCPLAFATEVAPPTEAEPLQPPRKCRMERPLGSRIGQRVCRTAQEEQHARGVASESAQRAFSRAQQSSERQIQTERRP